MKMLFGRTVLFVAALALGLGAAGGENNSGYGTMKKKIKIVAHRGESAAAPENTLESFSLAWERGAKCIEGDFHLTSDNVVVCMHDASAKRTCGVDRKLADMTLAEVKELDAGSWKDEAWRGAKVPTLAEVLATIPPEGEIYIELKSAGKILTRIRKIIKDSGCRPEQLTFISFKDRTIAAVKRHFPEHKAYWLTASARKDGRPKFATAEKLVAKLQKLGVDGVDIQHKLLTKEMVDALHAANLSVHVWTVDDPAVARKLIRMGVDSITTNRADALSQELSAK